MKKFKVNFMFLPLTFSLALVLVDGMEEQLIPLPNGYQLHHVRESDNERVFEKIKLSKEDMADYEDTAYRILMGNKNVSLFELDHNSSLNRSDTLIDVDGDGVSELIYYTWSGGVHCCYEMKLLSLRVEGITPLALLALANVERVTFEDINGDGMMEIKTYDDIFSYFGSFSFSSSPFIEIILELKEGEYQFSETLMQQKTVDFEAYNGMERLLYAIYHGRYQQGLGQEDDVDLSLPELVEQLSSSIYWKNIKNMNGWNDLSGKEILKLLQYLSKNKESI